MKGDGGVGVWVGEGGGGGGGDGGGSSFWLLLQWERLYSKEFTTLSDS